jgi:hypothetical protein
MERGGKPLEGFMTFKNTGVICMIEVADENREDGIRHIDLGNYFIAPDGSNCLITSIEFAKKYKDKINVPIYIRKKD